MPWFNPCFTFLTNASPTADDPLVDTEQCGRDAALMKTLGANTIRVYHVDADQDHSGCMGEFADAGIYALIDLDTFDTYILPVRRSQLVLLEWGPSAS
jgi:hypothetical protein